MWRSLRLAPFDFPPPRCLTFSIVTLWAVVALQRLQYVFISGGMIMVDLTGSIVCGPEDTKGRRDSLPYIECVRKVEHVYQ